MLGLRFFFFSCRFRGTVRERRVIDDVFYFPSLGHVCVITISVLRPSSENLLDLHASFAILARMRLSLMTLVDARETVLWEHIPKNRKKKK